MDLTTLTSTITCTADRNRVILQTGAAVGTIYVDNIVITDLSTTSGINSASESALAVTKSGSTFTFNQTLDNVTVFDMNGREVLKANDCDAINLSAYPNGVYIVKATSDSKSYVTKVIK